MKVLMPIDIYPPLSFGGRESHVQTLSKALCGRGHKVSIYTVGNKGLPSFQIENGIRLHRFQGLFQKMQVIPFLRYGPYRRPLLKSPPPIRDPLTTMRLKKVIEKEKPDIIHSHGWILSSVLPLKKKYGIPLVVTLHDPEFICPVAFFTPLLSSSYFFSNNTLNNECVGLQQFPMMDNEMCKKPFSYRCISCGKQKFGSLKSLLLYYALRMNKLKIKEVDKFIAVSPSLKSLYCKHLGIHYEDIFVVVNPIDLSLFSPKIHVRDKMTKYSRELGIEPSSNKIVYVSRMHLEKLDPIVRVMNAVPRIVREFPNTQILLVGHGECFHYVHQLAERINRQLNRPAIIMIGRVEQKDMPRILGFADVFVGIARTALEAMACGKPVIIIGGARIGPLGGNYGGIVTPNNITDLKAYNFSGRNSYEKSNSDKIAEDCLKLLTDKELRLSLGSFGRKYVEREYNIKKTVKQVENVYYAGIK